MGFYLTPTKYYILPVEPWGMRMQWEHTTLSKKHAAYGSADTEMKYDDLAILNTCLILV